MVQLSSLNYYKLSISSHTTHIKSNSSHRTCRVLTCLSNSLKMRRSTKGSVMGIARWTVMGSIRGTIRGSMQFWVSGAVLSALAGCGMTVSNSQTTEKVSTQANWTLVWADEFNGEALDRGKWGAETSCWGGGNNERQCYTDRPENIGVADGKLKITARPERFKGLKYSTDHENRGRTVTQEYTSGKIRTKGLAHWKYGRFEARIKLPKGQGTWPAFWMMPEESHYGKWPLSGEIDIMEAVNLGAKCRDCGPSETENRSRVALHYGQTWPKNAFQYTSHSLPNGINAYHIYAVEWSEGQIDWFVDDKKIFTMRDKDWFTGAIDKRENKLAPFDRPFHLILNLAVGGNLPENETEKTFKASSFPTELLVDWVRVYQCKQDMKTSKACLSP